MARPMKIESHLTVEEVKEKLHTADQERQRGKCLVIYNALVDPRPAATLALHTAISRWFVLCRCTYSDTPLCSNSDIPQTWVLS
jgi:hypothetical protein